VSAGFLNIADELDIPVFCAETDDLETAANTARTNFKQRQGEPRDEFAPAAQAAVGYSKASFKQVKAAKLEALLSKYPVKGVVILGGCNNVKATQDQSIVLQAKELLANDVLVMATGCAAAALAKAGMMDADQANHFASPGLVAFLGALAAAAGTGRLPAALHCGSCWQTPAAVELASSFGLPISASFPEISLPAAWSTAVALAALGIPTYVGPVLPVEGTPAAVAALATVLDNNLIAPIADELTPEITAQRVVAALRGQK
jgi:carbon-monoxide dehydrogenase catalytic subunit